MAGRHRRLAAYAQGAEQRGPRPVGIIDARTHIDHLMTDESAVAHRHSGHYLALCGVRVLAASLTDPGPWSLPGVRVVSDPEVEIEAVCEVHHGSGRLDVRREGDRIVLDGHADDCCVVALEDPAVTLLFGVLGEWLG